VLPVLGWIFGVFLLWRSDVWTMPEKLAGTLLWPGGYLTVGYVLGALLDDAASPSAASGPLPEALVTAAFMAFVLVPLAIAVFLGIRLVQRTSATGAA